MTSGDVVTPPNDTPASDVAPGVAVTTRGRTPGPWFFVVLAIAVILSGALAYTAIRHRNSQQGSQFIRLSGIPATVPTSIAQLMALSPVPHVTASNFTLQDQHGTTRSLESFRGRTVVLEFMDPHCVDICPIVSQEFVDAYHDLGSSASKVVFMAVNVNPYFTGVSDVSNFSKEHGLNTIPTWYFLTGPVKVLAAIWHAYGIEVVAPNPKADIIHTSVVYFISPNGQKRYVGVPMSDRNAKHQAYLPADQLSSWGKGIALVAASLSK